MNVISILQTTGRAFRKYTTVTLKRRLERGYKSIYFSFHKQYFHFTDAKITVYIVVIIVQVN